MEPTKVSTLVYGSHGTSSLGNHGSDALPTDEGAWKMTEDNLLEGPVPPTPGFTFLEDRDFYKKSNQGERRTMLAPFNVPGYLASQVCTDINGYFGCKSSFNTQDVLVDLSIWFRCLTKWVFEVKDREPYRWFEMGIFTRWSHPDVCQVLCVGTPPELRHRLKTALEESPLLEWGDPFAMVLPLLDQIITLSNDSIWRVRNEVREIEKDRGSHVADFVAMHDIARHVGHLVEVNGATAETVEGLLHRQRALQAGLPSLDKTYKEQSQEYLAFQLHMIKSLQRRLTSIQERINAEITLAYNIMAAQDNTVMKSIALLTVTFLPATFISALFSTTFFSFSEQSWNVSKKFWIYWAVAVPSTLLVLLVWWLGLGKASLHRWMRSNQRHRCVSE